MVLDVGLFPLSAALVWFAVCHPVQAQPIRAETLLEDLHRAAREQPPHDRLMLLWDLAIAATGVDPAASAAWSMEMFELAAQVPHEVRWQQMNQAAGRKNALTILSLTDPESAARHFLELEPSPGHQPNEDPRIDLARHLFPRLWAKQGRRSLPQILTFADFTGRTGQYPYIAIGHILPGLAKVDRAAAHSVWLTAVRHLGGERGIWRTPNDYLKFLREGWPAVTVQDRRLALEAALAVVRRGAEDQAGGDPGTRWYAEYYLPEGAVRFDSLVTARVFDLLPFVDRTDAEWGRRLRRQYPALVGKPLPRLDVAPWRAGLIVAPGRDAPARLQAGLERYRVWSLREWSQEDPKRAVLLARTAQDPVRRRAAMAQALPAFAKVDPVEAESLRQELVAGGFSVRTSDDLAFLVALARVHYALGHPGDGKQVTDAALTLGNQLASQRDRTRPPYAAEGAVDLRDLADLYGEFQPGGLASFIERLKAVEPPLRLYLLAGAVRGAMRHRPGYREPR